MEAGLISPEQAERIEAFEQGKEGGGVGPGRRPMFVFAVAGLGGLAIAIGLVSIVASNWDGIPGSVKLGIDLVLVAALGWGVWHWERKGPSWARETAIVALFGLVLASIALVGQVYQLGGKAHEALTVWIGLTALLMSRARSGFAAALWVIGIQVTWMSWIVWFLDRHDWGAFGFGSTYWAPLLCIAVGQVGWIRRARPRLASVLTAIGWSEVVIAATFGTFAFYDDTVREDWTAAYPAGLISALLAGWIMRKIPSSPAAVPARWLLGVCTVGYLAPFLVSPGGLDLVAALSFIGLWLLVAFVAHRRGDVRVLNVATAVVGVRILVVYFEVFGSLLDTGVGLVSGGLLTLALVWLWARKRRDFERELRKEGA